LEIINGEMEHKAVFKDKTGINAVATHSDMKSNIPRGGLSLTIPFCIAFIPLTNNLNSVDCGYQVQGTVRRISHLLYMDDF
jgi:hypothetical protein